MAPLHSPSHSVPGRRIAEGSCNPVSPELGARGPKPDANALALTHAFSLKGLVAENARVVINRQAGEWMSPAIAQLGSTVLAT